MTSLCERSRGPHFQNLASLFPIAAHREDLTDHDSLVRILNRQLRDQLMRDADLGLLELSRVACRLPRFFGRTIDRMLRDNYSLWYGYFGSADAAGERFCGTDFTAVRYVGPSWPPAGLTLLVNQSRGQTHLQATYLPSVVPDSLARDFLDTVVQDLVDFVGRGATPAVHERRPSTTPAPSLQGLDDLDAAEESVKVHNDKH